MPSNPQVYVIEWRTPTWMEWHPLASMDPQWDRQRAFVLLRNIRARDKGLPYEYRVATYRRVEWSR